MGVYLNPGPYKFQEARRAKIYVDKSGLLNYTNEILGTPQKYICVSRPRRFGKSMAADMLSAYYDRTVTESTLFDGLAIAQSPVYRQYLHQYDVIKVNMQEFLSESADMAGVLALLRKSLLWEILAEYSDVNYFDRTNLTRTLNDLFVQRQVRFVIIIDEWDAIFREYPHDTQAQRQYLDFLRDWLKDKSYVALAYMTGILPIKKYGTHSALNMFSEFSMESPGQLAPYVGFTETEVSALCHQYQVDVATCRSWYDGYQFPIREEKCLHIYNPNSIVQLMRNGRFEDYWNQTETYEALQIYIDMNYDGLRDAIVRMLAGDEITLQTGSFQNDMTSFANADDVLTLLVHLGYLSYNPDTQQAFIPNREIMKEFVTATTASQPWDEVVRAVQHSQQLLEATWQEDAESVAAYIEQAHLETSHLQYNDENALAYTVSLVYYAARQYYTLIRELPTGKGFADLAFIPLASAADKSALLVELKWNQSAHTAIEQIRAKQYPEALRSYQGNLLLVGVNYDKKTRQHICRIEEG